MNERGHAGGSTAQSERSATAPHRPPAMWRSGAQHSPQQILFVAAFSCACCAIAPLRSITLSSIAAGSGDATAV